MRIERDNLTRDYNLEELNCQRLVFKFAPEKYNLLFYCLNKMSEMYVIISYPMKDIL
jgi:hypothetical protein